MWGVRCILSKFYIKPQLFSGSFYGKTVVSYRNSTSNHNYQFTTNNYPYVVSYRNSTSNHNLAGVKDETVAVVSYRNSTSNHNYLESYLRGIRVVSYRNSTSNHNVELKAFGKKPVVSYRNSTSNHNSGVGINATMSLYLIEILHQTTTSGLILIDKVLLTGCLPL